MIVFSTSISITCLAGPFSSSAGGWRNSSANGESARGITATVGRHGPGDHAMSMTFKVKDNADLQKLGEGRKAEFELVQEGKDYVITQVN